MNSGVEAYRVEQYGRLREIAILDFYYNVKWKFYWSTVDSPVVILFNDC